MLSIVCQSSEKEAVVMKHNCCSRLTFTRAKIFKKVLIHFHIFSFSFPFQLSTKIAALFCLPRCFVSSATCSVSISVLTIFQQLSSKKIFISVWQQVSVYQLTSERAVFYSPHILKRRKQDFSHFLALC